MKNTKRASSKTTLFALGVGVALIGCVGTVPAEEEEGVGWGSGAYSSSTSGATDAGKTDSSDGGTDADADAAPPPPPPPPGCYEDPQPATGDTRGCCVAENSTKNNDDGSCDVTISADVDNQKPGCSDYNNPNPTTQAFLDQGMTVQSSGCSVSSAPKGKDTTIHCNSCPKELEVTVKDGPNGRKVKMPVP